MAEESERHEPWSGITNKTKEMIDMCINGGKYTYTDSRGQQTIDFGNGLLGKYSNKKFIENLGEYTYNADNSASGDSDYNSGLLNNRTKRVIIYTLQN